MGFPSTSAFLFCCRVHWAAAKRPVLHRRGSWSNTGLKQENKTVSRKANQKANVCAKGMYSQRPTIIYGMLAPHSCRRSTCIYQQAIQAKKKAKKKYVKPGQVVMRCNCTFFFCCGGDVDNGLGYLRLYILGVDADCCEPSCCLLFGAARCPAV